MEVSKENSYLAAYPAYSLYYAHCRRTCLQMFSYKVTYTIRCLHDMNSSVFNKLCFLQYSLDFPLNVSSDKGIKHPTALHF